MEKGILSSDEIKMSGTIGYNKGKQVVVHIHPELSSSSIGSQKNKGQKWQKPNPPTDQETQSLTKKGMVCKRNMMDGSGIGGSVCRKD